MSRIGNKLIPVPSGVKVQIKPDAVEVQGPKGKMTVPLPHGIHFEQKDNILTAKRATENQRALHGLARALVANAVTGVTQGFKKDLDIVGVGYRAEVKGKNVVARPGLFAPHRVSDPGRDRHRRRKADAHVGFRREQKSGRAGGREPSRASSSRPVQTEGYSHHRRAA